MKILYVVSTLKRSGPINVVWNIIRHLDREQFNPFILTLSPEPRSSDRERFLELGVPLHSLNRGHVQGLFEGKRFSEMVSRISPTLLHTHGFRSDLLAALSLHRFRTISTLHNDPFQDYPRKFGTVRGRLMGKIHLATLGRIGNVAACANSVGEVAERNGIPAQVIPNGIDNESFNSCSSVHKYHLRQRLGIPADRRVFLSVGSLITRKAPFTIIEAFLDSEAEKSGILIFLGDGPLVRECQRLAEGKENILFAGPVKNVIDYLQAADVFISASVSEGLPNAVLEAMACGLPVVLSDIPSHKEIFEVRSGAGKLFPVGDFSGMARCIDSIDAEDRNSMGNIASEIVAERFSAKQMSNKYQVVYLEMSDVDLSRGPFGV